MKILLIEDDYNLALGLKYSLKDEGFEVVYENTLSSGKENYLRENPDLILLDITLPDGNGYDFCEFVREKDKNIPVIFLTALEKEECVVKGFGLGADDYVTKPFRVSELTARIRAHYKRYESLKKSNPQMSQIEANPDFKIDQTRLCIWKKGERIDLTPTEYKIVRKLTENPGETVSRDALLECCWDTTGEYLDVNTLSVHIKRIREKLGENDKEGHIRTVRGEGYVFASSK